MLAQGTQISIQALDTFFMGLHALSLEALIELGTR